MVPHVAAPKTHQRLSKFSFVIPKRLLQQYRGSSGHRANPPIEGGCGLVSSCWEGLESRVTEWPGRAGSSSPWLSRSARTLNYLGFPRPCGDFNPASEGSGPLSRAAVVTDCDSAKPLKQLRLILEGNSTTERCSARATVHQHRSGRRRVIVVRILDKLFVGPTT